jgi:hypothetical protein
MVFNAENGRGGRCSATPSIINERARWKKLEEEKISNEKDCLTASIYTNTLFSSSTETRKTYVRPVLLQRIFFAR